MNELFQQYRALLARVDTWFSRSAATAGSSVHCTAGCSDCCRGLFDITLLDAAYLNYGFRTTVAKPLHEKVLARCRRRLRQLRSRWPEFGRPFVLNYRPENDWEQLMPDDDESPCVLLGDDGRCLVYDHRPLTCRLHGLPLIALTGEVLHDEWCTLNFVGQNPLAMPLLREDFPALFYEEGRLGRSFSAQLTGTTFDELDTFIPTALLIDFARFDWRTWREAYRAYHE